MGIYFDKARDKYEVVVRYNGLRLPKVRFDSEREARRAEADWKKGKNLLPVHLDKIKGTLPEALKSPVKASEVTIEDLYKDAGFIWSDKKDALFPPTMAQYVAKFLSEVCKHTDPWSEIPVTYFDDFIKISRRDGMFLRPDQRTNGQGVAGATINHYLKAFRTAWKFYAKRGLCHPKPWADYPTLPEVTEKEGRLRWMSKKEESQIQEYFEARAIDAPKAGPQLRVLSKMVSVSIKTGLRWAELANLSKEQLKLENNDGERNNHYATIFLNNAQMLKTKQMRSIPISKETYDECLFILDNGGPVTKDCKRFHWRKMKEHLGITDPDFCWHALRHTSATRLVSLGRDIRVIQKFMGHARIETTLRYAHVSAKMISTCTL